MKTWATPEMHFWAHAKHSAYHRDYEYWVNEWMYESNEQVSRQARQLPPCFLILRFCLMLSQFYFFNGQHEGEVLSFLPYFETPTKVLSFLKCEVMMWNTSICVWEENVRFARDMMEREKQKRGSSIPIRDNVDTSPGKKDHLLNNQGQKLRGLDDKGSRC